MPPRDTPPDPNHPIPASVRERGYHHWWRAVLHPRGATLDLEHRGGTPGPRVRGRRRESQRFSCLIPHRLQSRRFAASGSDALTRRVFIQASEFKLERMLNRTFEALPVCSLILLPVVILA